MALDDRVPDLYELLGVPPEAPAAEITRAYHRQARALHPDSGREDGSDSARFRAVAEAYRILGDPSRRSVYDRTLARRDPRSPEPFVTTGHPLTPPASSAWQRPPAPPDSAARILGPAVVAGPVHIEPPGSRRRPDAGPPNPAEALAVAWLLARLLTDDWGSEW